jgi:polyisoprenyl-phosphate glycosyltransferase
MAENYNNKKIISICIPVRNESENIFLMYNEIKKIFSENLINYNYEIIFTDNLSTDKTFEIIKEISKKDNKVKGYQFSKNIDKERSLFFAFKQTTGLCTIQLDCDFEDPPEIIPRFVEKWEQGFDVVYGIRNRRVKDPYYYLRLVFYRLIDLISKDNLPRDAGDFRLCDQKVINKILQIDDQDPYIRGLISSIGYKQFGITHDRGERKKNKTKFNLFNYFSNAINGITNHSILPLKLASYLGFLVFIISGILTIFYFFHALFFPTQAPGFSTQTILALFAISFNAIFLGILGEYVGRIYRQIKKNDVYFVKEDTES